MSNSGRLKWCKYEDSSTWIYTESEKKVMFDKMREEITKEL